MNSPLGAMLEFAHGKTEGAMDIRPFCLATALIVAGCNEVNRSKEDDTSGMSPEYASVFRAAIARGDQALARGDSGGARSIWKAVHAISPNASVQSRISRLPAPSGWQPSEQDEIFLVSASGLENLENYCDFPEATDSMRLTSLRMIADTEIVPNLSSVGIAASPNCPFPDRSCLSITPEQDFESTGGRCDALVFLGAPALSIDEIIARYGAPQTDARNQYGGRILTYGVIRIVGDESERASLVAYRAPQL